MNGSLPLFTVAFEPANVSHDSTHHHRHDPEEAGVAVLTISSSRTHEDDPAGDAIAALLESAAETRLEARTLVRDDQGAIGETVESLANRSAVDAVVTTGGTGITSDDVTIEALESRFDKELPGFGEVFRRRSEDDIGTRVVATRATAGVLDDVVAFALPGSEAAVRLGVTEIVIPEVTHLVGLARQ